MKGTATFDFDDGTVLTYNTCEFTLAVRTVMMVEPCKRLIGSIKNPPLILSLLSDHTNLIFSFKFFEKKRSYINEIKIVDCYFTGADVEEVFFESEDTEGLDILIYS